MHHYALCRKTSSQFTTPREDSMNSTTVQYCKAHQEINVLATESGNNTTLPTAQLKLINRKSRVNTRGPFDQGSQKTFVTQQLVEQLKLKPAKCVKLSISGFLTNSGSREYQVVKVLVRLGSSTNSIQAVVVDKLPSDLQVTGLAHTEISQTVGLQEEDRDFTKFLCIKDPLDLDSDVITYRFASVLFGATSSPFLLQATVDTHLKKSNSPYKAEITNNLYVDNFQGITNDKFKLVEIYHEANQQNLLSNLHIFCDASGKAYGTAAYLVNNAQSFLLTLKAGVASIKKRSLPQMELTALLVGVRLAHCLTKTLNNIHFGEIEVWSDNVAILQWGRNNNNKIPYVSNRVREIHELSAGYKLRHVRTKDNPADYLSRGLSLKQLIKSLMWFNGPSLLVSGQWPKQKQEVIVTNITNPMTDPEPHQTLAINSHNYSNLRALLLTGTPDKVPVKPYICLFTCATTRGVHLEVTSDMSAEVFIQAFRRFAARRSCPKLMISDNGSNFVAGTACLREIWNHPEVQSVMQRRQCHWKFIPPRTPWQGGFYERMVGTIKKCLSKTLQRQKISFPELETLVEEIEQRVNNRPLTYLLDNFSQREPLSPSHLIHGSLLSPLIPLAEEDPVDPSHVTRSDLVESYQHLLRVVKK
ncbi:uncharacterized protein [Procambarus clarkii]|uniref:uncharacterized protein n=1 Tax=Procambarus clarkii TaxID=6728 RepID=UPI00374314D7